MQIYNTFECDYGRPEFPYTNDGGLSEVASAVAIFNADNPIDPDECALIVGTGALLSLADLMPPHVYLTDKSPALLSWMYQQVTGLRDSDSPAVFRSRHKPDEWSVTREMDIVGDRHFLASNASYDRARAAMGNLSIRYVEMDYSDEEEVSELADHLSQRGQRVRLFNATNMHNHILKINKAEYEEALSLLPWADKYRIMASNGIFPKSWPILESLAEYQYGIYRGGVSEQDLNLLFRDPRGKITEVPEGVEQGTV